VNPNPKSVKKAVTLSDIQAELKAIRRRLDFVIVRLGSSAEEVRAFEAGMREAEKEFKFNEAQKAFAAEQVRKKNGEENGEER
jgi:hypothetical protein